MNRWGLCTPEGTKSNEYLALWKDDVYAVKNRVKALRIVDCIGMNVKMIGWQVMQKDVYTKDGLVMSFLSLEDESALYETVIFLQVYDRYNKLLFDQRPLLVYGKVVNDEGAISLEVSRLEWLGKANTARGVKELTTPDCAMVE